VRSVYSYPRGRAEAHLAAIGALARLGRLAEAVDEARTLAAASDWRLDGWDELLVRLQRDAPAEMPEVVLELLIADRTGAFVDAASRTMVPEVLAELGLAYVLMGGTLAEACTTCVTAALVVERWDLLAAWAPHLHLIPAETRDAIAARATNHGHADVASLLTAAR
jgi:hypothetical protein